MNQSTVADNGHQKLQTSDIDVNLKQAEKSLAEGYAKLARERSILRLEISELKKYAETRNFSCERLKRIP